MEQFELKETVKRIKKMEKRFDKLQNALKKDLNAHKKAWFKRDLNALTAYYESKQWLSDYELDERGDLPPDLKRGVLSEDGIYNFLAQTVHLNASDEA